MTYSVRVRAVGYNDRVFDGDDYSVIYQSWMNYVAGLEYVHVAEITICDNNRATLATNMIPVAYARREIATPHPRTVHHRQWTRIQESEE